MGRGRFIVILGPVGVGKSTMIRALRRFYEVRGVRTSSVFIKSYHGPSYILWRLVARLLNLPGRYAPWYEIPVSGRMNLARALTLISSLLDSYFLLFKLIRAFILRSLGFVVFSEEYFHSTFIDYYFAWRVLRMRGRLPRLSLLIIYSLMLRFKPDTVVILDADVNTLRSRWAGRGYGDSQLHYVLFQKVVLDKLFIYQKGGQSKVFKINTDGLGIKETFNTILKVII
ncbi:hypothetical protein [Vulcanisaeta thermophila]|uniref:hypothetical protein n=1 Tax=Vulcanisaeta thermophila TaxID=867917 RepID=UPI000852F8CF|nr:hypothetical protein [Vulcanisaeta thermophila]